MAQLTRTAPRARTGIALAGLGVFLALCLVAGLAHWSGVPLLLGSFGATCVLLFGFPDSPFSATRNVVGGHLLSSLSGLLCLQLPLPAWSALALGVAIALVLMMLTRTVHPRLAATP